MEAGENQRNADKFLVRSISAFRFEDSRNLERKDESSLHLAPKVYNHESNRI